MREAAQPITSFLVRTQGAPLALVPSVERELASIDRGLPLERATTLRDVVGQQLAGRRLPLLLIGAFGAFALLLASVGVYAMFANLIAAREREFGVRLALGSAPGAIAGRCFARASGGWPPASTVAAASYWSSVCCGICSTACRHSIRSR